MYVKAVEARREYSSSAGEFDCPELLPSTSQAVRLPRSAYEHVHSVKAGKQAAREDNAAGAGVTAGAKINTNGLKY